MVGLVAMSCLKFLTQISQDLGIQNHTKYASHIHYTLCIKYIKHTQCIDYAPCLSIAPFVSEDF